MFLRPTVIRSEKEASRVTKDKYNAVWEVEIESTNHEQLDSMFDGERPTPEPHFQYAVSQRRQRFNFQQ